MRSSAFIFILLLIVTRFIVGCNKEDNSDPQSQPSKEIISGDVILPTGLSANTNEWTVNSGFGETNITEGRYAVLENSNGFNPQFVSDAQDNVILMGYSYPGQKDKTISAQSTVLAMTMLLPGVSSLNEQGKLDLINKIKNNAKFNEAVVLLENQLSGGGKLFDTLNGGAYYEKITELFSSAALRTRSTENESVNFIVSGKTVIFQNPGKAFNQMVGIYKNENLVKRFFLPRYQYVATSITEGISNTFTPPEPIEEVYTFPADGNYDVKIRTGKSLNDEEGKLAAGLNAAYIAIDFFVMPYLNKTIDDAKVRQECLKELGVSLTDYATTLVQNASDMNASIILEAAVFGVNLIPNLLVCSNADLGNNPSSKYLKKWIKLTKFVKTKITETVYFATNSINLGIATYQWFTTPASKDTCFKVAGNTLGKCENCNLLSFTDIRDGKVYKKVQIGTQEWMAENLNYSTGNSWCYDNNPSNCNVYGRLYDWETAKTACPSGWHLPSDAEWTTLTSFLGGEAVAGGKMKSTNAFWEAPNAGATNSSCWSGLPGGLRYGDGVFNAIGSLGSWWSSTEGSTLDAWYSRLGYSSSAFVRYYFYKSNGFSVRCLRD